MTTTITSCAIGFTAFNFCNLVLENVAVDCALQHLLDSSVDIGIHDNDGMSALMWCCHGDHLHHLRLLLKQVRKQFADDCLSDHDVCGKTWLHWCVRRTQPLHCLQVASSLLKGLQSA